MAPSSTRRWADESLSLSLWQSCLSLMCLSLLLALLHICILSFLRISHLSIQLSKPQVEHSADAATTIYGCGHIRATYHGARLRPMHAQCQRSIVRSRRARLSVLVRPKLQRLGVFAPRVRDPLVRRTAPSKPWIPKGPARASPRQL